jgi:peptidoglycan/xylan/chitin deacetylase (PgdA/CDA1 family)
MIALTFDIDWAPDAVIEDTLALLDAHGAKATLFATHETAVLDGLDAGRIEVGIHPNFNPLLDGGGGSVDAVLDRMLEAFPAARGVRSHSMTQSSGLLAKFAERGLIYDANHVLPYLPVQPFRLWTGMVRIPYNWEDDVHWLYGRSFDDAGIDVDGWPLCVFDFHPIHVYLNTESADRYAAARAHYQDPRRLAGLRNTTSTPGARDMLLGLLRRMAERRDAHTLSEVAATVPP